MIPTPNSITLVSYVHLNSQAQINHIEKHFTEARRKSNLFKDKFIIRATGIPSDIYIYTLMIRK